MSLAAQLVIADPGLRSSLGHHLGYSQAVAQAALAQGIRPLILAARDFHGQLPHAVACAPRFTCRYQSAGGGGALRRGLFGLTSYLPAPLAGQVAPPLRMLRRLLRQPAGDSFGAELAAALAEDGVATQALVLLHSVSAANLAGIPAALPAEAVGALAVVLRRTPAEMDLDDAGPGPAVELLGRMAAHFGERLRLLADTVPLQKIWSQALALPVRVAPLPVVAPPVRDTMAGSPPHLVFAGGARPEKGYALLPTMVRALRDRAHFTIHSGPVGAHDDPLVQQAHRRLRRLAGPGLRLLEQPLPPDAYQSLLRGADLLLLPYRAAAYGPRSSGILAEARAMGVPAVVPAGCWMADAVGPVPDLIFVRAADFTSTVERALGCLPRLLREYAAAAPAWRAVHSPESFLRALLS